MMVSVPTGAAFDTISDGTSAENAVYSASHADFFAFPAIKRRRAGFHNQRDAVCRTAPVDSSAQE